MPPADGDEAARTPAIQYGRGDGRRPAGLRGPRRERAYFAVGRADGPGGGEPFAGRVGGSRGRVGAVVGSGRLLIAPYPAVVDLHQLEVEVEVHPGGQVVDPDRVQLVLGTAPGCSGPGAPARSGRRRSRRRARAPGAGGASRIAWALSTCEYAEFHHPLLDLVQLGEGSQLPDVGPDVVGDVVLERHQRPPLPLVADQGRPVIITLGPADEGKFRVGTSAGGSVRSPENANGVPPGRGGCYSDHTGHRSTPCKEFA